MDDYPLTDELLSVAATTIAACQDLLYGKRKRKLRELQTAPSDVRALSERAVVLKDGRWQGRAGHVIYKEIGDV